MFKMPKIKTNSLYDNRVSVKRNNRVKDNYFLPESVWKIRKTKFLTELVKDVYNRDVDPNKKLSELNPDVIVRCINLYARDSKTILDPFLNRGTTPIMSAYLGKIGYANDIVPLYVNQVLKRKDELIKEGHEWAKNIYINCGDARDIKNIVNNVFKLEYVDYIITSPPFYNIEPYESVDGQMSDIESYDDFLEEYKKVIEQLYEIIRSGSFITYIVNDFVKNKKFYGFHTDTINIFKQVGFEQHDVVINYLWTPFIMRSGLAFNNERRCIKTHEYVLTFKKP